jgi:CubicO group peptidase (beta-lactamase class C family)
MRALRFVLGAAFAALIVHPAVAQESVLRDSASVILEGPKAAAADSALRAEEAKGFSGVVLIATGGRVILRKGYGLAVREPKRAFAPSTVVQIGSNTKDFTAVAILQLQEQGKLSVHDSLGKFFKDVPADKRGITVWDLVTHRSGLPLYSGMDFEPVTREQFVARVMAMPLRFPAGTQQAYSNVGYSVLAAIIEQLVNDTYGGYVNAHIWKPLGMHDTGLLLVKWDTLRLAHGYQGAEDNGTMLDKPHADNGPYWNLRGNGGYISTVTDMYHFYDVLFNTNTLLQPATRDLRFPPDRPVALAGSDMINFFLYERDPRSETVLIMATNWSEYPAPKAREGVAAVLGLPAMGNRGGTRVGGPRPAETTPAKPIALPDTPAGRQAGAYIAMFNAGDTTAARKFMLEQLMPNPNDHRTIEQRLSNYRGMRSQVGTMIPVEIVSSSPTEIVLRMRTEKGESPELTVTVEASAPYRISALRIMAE